MADTTESTATKTETLLATCKKAKGATVEEIMEATGQTAVTVRSRLHTLGKAGKVEPIDGSSPRRYKTVKAAKV